VFAQSVELPEISVVSTTPLAPRHVSRPRQPSAGSATSPAAPSSDDSVAAAGSSGGIDRDKVPAMVQTVTADDIVRTYSQNVVDTLTATGQLDNTYIVFTSDNGFHMGQHRLVAGKNTEFDEDLRVPLIVRGPAIPAGQTRQEATLNIDFTPTFLELAGAAIPDAVDGRSIAALVRNVTPPAWRQFIFIEHAADTDDDARDNRPQGIRSTLEPSDQLDPGAKQEKYGPPFEGVRTPRYTFAQYTTNETVVYDHVADPDQLNNLGSGADLQLVTRLTALVASMHNCSGSACRSAEEATP